ncbi:MAG TPA: hypothetical protein VD816_15550 [Ohtaekwangia sp.]|nr:hypothetical protein [Ohtaekwangia sp.]
MLGLIYTQAGQYDMAESFYNRALALADTLKLQSVKINTYFQMIDMYAADNKVDQALQLFKARPELTAFLKGSGFFYFIDQAYGMGYTQMGKLDSAYYFLKRAEPVLEENASRSNRFWFYNNMVRHFKKREDYKNALVYAKKAEIIGDHMKDLSLRMRVAGEMDFLYMQLNDFKSAYAYSELHQQLKTAWAGSRRRPVAARN